LNEKDIISDLKEIEQQDSITKAKLTIRESRLAVTSTEIKEQFYDLITKIENEISGLVNAKASAAGNVLCIRNSSCNSGYVYYCTIR
jgi:hypothetical protein